MKKSIKNKIRLLVVDDHPLVFEGIKACLKGQRRIEIVGQASDGEEAIRKTKALHPDLVLMDIGMPKMGGLEATRVLRKEVPQAKVLALTMHHNREYILEMNRAGAKGYVLKDASPQELMRSILSVYQDRDFASSSAPYIQKCLQEERTNQAVPARQQALTRREREVLALLADGLANKEIAQRLNRSVRTVETHRERIMRKLSIHSVAGLTKYALARGIDSSA